MAISTLKRAAWTTALALLASGSGLYSASLLVALASDDSTWDRYIPLFRSGQDIGFLIFVASLMMMAVAAVAASIGWLIEQINRGDERDTGAAAGTIIRSTDRWRSYKVNRIILLALVLGWVPVASTLEFSQAPEEVDKVLMFVWSVALIFETYQLAVWPCPNCGRSFRGPLPFLPKQCRYCDYKRR
jgi:hypothetical protein